MPPTSVCEYFKEILSQATSENTCCQLIKYDNGMRKELPFYKLAANLNKIVQCDYNLV